MISTQRNHMALLLFFPALLIFIIIILWPYFLPHQNRPRVTHICAEDFVADDKDGDAGGPTEPQVDLGVAAERVLHRRETLFELLFDLR